MARTRNAQGFGLIELLVTLAVLTLVISIGVPSFESFMQKNRTASRIDEINAALRLARQVALEHSHKTLVCPKQSSALNSTNCGTKLDWDNGFLVKMLDGSSPAPVLMNKSFGGQGLETSIYKKGVPSATLGSLEFLGTGNLNTTVTGPAVRITVRQDSCVATTDLNITGRSIEQPLQNC